MGRQGSTLTLSARRKIAFARLITEYLVSPENLHAELDLPGGRSCRVDDPGTPRINAIESGDSIELKVVDRRLEICVIENIEDFKAQLHCK